jgi:hypothetical protein
MIAAGCILPQYSLSFFCRCTEIAYISVRTKYPAHLQMPFSFPALPRLALLASLSLTTFTLTACEGEERQQAQAQPAEPAAPPFPPGQNAVNFFVEQRALPDGRIVLRTIQRTVVKDQTVKERILLDTMPSLGMNSQTENGVSYEARTGYEVNYRISADSSFTRRKK